MPNLNQAQAAFVGDSLVARIYLGADLAWSYNNYVNPYEVVFDSQSPLLFADNSQELALNNRLYPVVDVTLT